MGIVFRQSIKNGFVILTGALLGVLVIWLSTQFIREKLLFGYTKTITQQAVTLSQFVVFGLNNTLAVFIHRFAKQKNKSSLLITLCFSLPLIIAAVLTLTYWLLKEWILRHFQPADIPLMRQYFMWLPLYTILLAYMVTFEQYLASQMKVALSAFMREIVVRFLSILLLLLFAFGIVQFSTLVIGTILIYIVPLSIFLIISAKTKQFRFSLNFSAFSKDEYKDFIRFTWYHFLLTGSIALISSMDILLLPLYDHSGNNAVAIYSIPIFLLSFLQMPYKAMLQGSFTVLARAFADNDIAHARDLFVRSSVNMLIATVFMAVVITCNLHNAVAVIKNGYDAIIPVFEILLIGKVFDIATGMNDQILSIANYYKFNLYVSAFLILVLFGLLRFLVPLYGVNGAAAATSIAILVFNTIKFLFVWKKLDMQPFSMNTVKIVLAGVVTGVAGWLFPYMGNPIVDTVVRSLIIILIYTGFLIWLRPSADLVTYLANVKNKKRLY